jgi:hypothetical protein
LVFKHELVLKHAPFLSRLDDKRKGTNRGLAAVHIDDLCEHLWATSWDWTTLGLPAIAESDEVIAIGENEFYHRKAGEALHPEREPLEILKKLESEIGAYDFAAQYLQCPVPVGGAMIQREWLRHYAKEELPERSYGIPKVSTPCAPSTRQKRLTFLTSMA